VGQSPPQRPQEVAVSTVLLAGSIREANAYRLDTGKRFARMATIPKQVNHATTIIELPGFKNRRDRFALQNARDARIKYGHGVEYIDAYDWVPAPKVVEEVEALEVLNEDLQFGDLTDEETLVALKAALNEVGLTLKKLPKKTPDEAPVVDLAAALRTSVDEAKGLSFPEVQF
jgi:hypothetical protein